MRRPSFLPLVVSSFRPRVAFGGRRRCASLAWATLALAAIAVPAAAQSGSLSWSAPGGDWDEPWLPADWRPDGWTAGATACVGLPISFHDPAGASPGARLWQWDDGSSVTSLPGEAVQHAFRLPGDHAVLVRLDDGSPSQWSATVRVVSCAVPPPPNGCPVIDVPSALDVRPGEWASIVAQARDGNAWSAPDPVEVRVTLLPPVPQPPPIVSVVDAAAAVSWMPSAEDAGRYVSLLFEAGDGICAVSALSVLRVQGVPAATSQDGACLAPCASSTADAPSAPALPDVDQDGTPDAADNCPSTANASQADLDYDSRGDACDEDRDGDEVANAIDNCPGLPNRDQADLDRDGNGDACHAATLLASDPAVGTGMAAGTPPSGGSDLATLTAVAALGAAAAATALPWWRKLPLAGLLLFSRLRTDELAQHPGRAALLQAVAANPGASLATLQAVTGMSRSVAAHHLRTLARGGLVRRHEWMGTVGFHPARHEASNVHMVRVDPSSLDAHAALRSETARALVESLVRMPGQTLQQVSSALGMARGTVHYHLHRCAAAGLVWLEEGAPDEASPAKAYPTALAARLVNVPTAEILEAPMPQMM